LDSGTAEFDGGLRPAAVGLAIASHFLDEGRTYAKVPSPENACVYVIHRGGKSLAVMFVHEGLDLPLKSAKLRLVTCYDVMGNPLPPSDQVTLSASPIYVTLEGTPEQLFTLLRDIVPAR
jgi:hypothetical protein